ncbi:hypothetical protein [Synechococcus sp. M16CYN]|uniref:hypothetical protein n=1 Tax=Synechococcus sp. M16CYN TaxID=3103139 RepID=UPI00325189D1
MVKIFLLNGKPIRLTVPSDHAVAVRIARHMQRRIVENDWKPYLSQSDALRAWSKLGGIRLDVLRALGLI